MHTNSVCRKHSTYAQIHTLNILENSQTYISEGFTAIPYYVKTIHRKSPCTKTDNEQLHVWMCWTISVCAQ